jgi:hypothetical protein
VAETQKNHGIRLNAIDGRLALIEEHTGKPWPRCCLSC